MLESLVVLVDLVVDKTQVWQMTVDAMKSPKGKQKDEEAITEELFLPANLTSIPATLDAHGGANVTDGGIGSTSNARMVLCQTCSSRNAIYTCPRCGFRSCSLPCLNAHKTGSLSPISSHTPYNGAAVAAATFMAGKSSGDPSAFPTTNNGRSDGEVGKLVRTSTIGCTGVRENNAGGYVDMNAYGYQAFVQDYVFLEELGRRASEWGRDIQKQKLGAGDGGNQVSFAPGTKGVAARGAARGAARVHHHRHNHHYHGRTKREMLKERLEEDWEIEMLLLPEGMEKRKVNQSTWDPRSRKGYLTAQYRFHRRFPPSPPSSIPPKTRPSSTKSDLKATQSEDESPIPILTHRNELGCSIHQTLQRSLRERRSRKAEPFPNWITEFWDKILQDDVAPSSVEREGGGRPHGGSPMTTAKRKYSILLATETSSVVTSPAPKSVPVRRKYVEVDFSGTFASVLKQRNFIEFPTFEVVPFGDYSGLLEGDALDHEERTNLFDVYSNDDEQMDENSSQEVEDEDLESGEEVEEPRRKRRKVDEEAGKRLFNGLMDYGDGTDSDASGVGTGEVTRAKGEKGDNPVDDGQRKGARGLLGSLDYSSDESSSESDEEEESKRGIRTLDGRSERAEVQKVSMGGYVDGDVEVDWD